MEKLENYEFLNSPFMSSEEINFILLEPTLEDISSPQAKTKVRQEMVNVLGSDLSGVLMLPFLKTEYR
jgi:hypothetical protein